MHERSSCRARKRLRGHNASGAHLGRLFLQFTHMYWLNHLAAWLYNPCSSQSYADLFENPSIQNIFTEFEVDVTAHGGDQRSESFLPVPA